jgi:excisionase family DNA binding protein
MPKQPLDPYYTVSELLEAIRVSRSTFSKWCSEGRGPEMIRLPNNEYRIRRSAIDAWLDSLPRG